MAKVRWTENQLNAINARKGAVLVSAAAGSGKTAVLVERVIDMITDPENPVDADRFLVVTYTRAAAGEMKERIAARLDQLLSADPYNANLHRQQLLLGRASISTIHSFCSDLVREYFYTLDIPSDFRIGEEQELTILKNAAMQTVLEQKYSEKDYVFENTVEVFSSVRDDKILQKIVLMLYEFLRSHPFPKDWIKEKISMYDLTLSAEQTEWGKTILARAELSARFIKSLNTISLEMLEDEPKLRDAKFGDRIRDDSAFIDLLIKRIDSKNWNDIIHHLNTYTAGTLSTPRGFADNEVKLTVADYRKIVKSTIEEIRSLFFRNNEECMDDIADLAPVVRELFNVMLLFSDEFARLKKERSLADFSDLEHWALRLLVRNVGDGIEFTEIAREVASRFDYVMVDEYQDANTIQDTIFKAVSDNDSKLFVVGDVKQSIYRFRQAMPEIFIGRKDRYNLYNPEKESYPAKIILDRNFRSRKGVTDGVNFVFKNLMSKSVGDIDYTSEEELVAGASYDEDNGNAISFHLLNLKGSDSENKDTEEARYIGGLIYNMMETMEITDKQGKRKPRFGDFCILLRSSKTHVQSFVEELAKLGIPSFSETDESLFSSYEIQVVLSLLRVIDNPVQDVPLAAVLMSPIFGFTADELARYRVNSPYDSLYSALLAENNSGNEKTKAFTDTLARLRKLSTSVTADVMINRIYTETSYPDIACAAEDGEYRRKNLRLLLQYAKNYEQSGYRGLSGFIKFMDRLQENGCNLSAADRHSDSNENAVSIMTIHKSKGLEYPICIVANMARKINSDLKNEVLLHNELGLGVRKKDDKNICRYTTMPREAVALEIKRDEMSEELRVLYVAMTRAKERLVLVASVPDVKKYLSKTAKKLAYDGTVSPYTVSSAGMLCDWIVDCMLIHPCGSALRNIAGYNGAVSHDITPDWDINIVEDLSAEQSLMLPHVIKALTDDVSNDELDFEEEGEKTEREILRTITARLNSEYKYQSLTEIPVKVSASAVAHKESELSFAAVSVPAFMKKSRLSGAEKGTALHTFVQYCDFDKAKQSFDVEAARLLEKGFITEVQAAAIDREGVEAFLNSELMDRMLSSPMLERECRFTVEIPAGVADETLEFPYSDEPIILQGAVDCIFEENGKAVIVDYKTDRVKAAEELVERYESQLKLYKLAVEQITEKKVSQCLIYSFCLNSSIKVFEQEGIDWRTSENHVDLC